MRIPDPKANTTTEAYLAYKAGYLEESELKPVLYEPYLHFDAWLAYWAGLTSTYPNKGAGGKNLAYTGWADDFVNRINDNARAGLVTQDDRSCIKWRADAGYGDYDNKYMFKIDFEENTQYTFSFAINPSTMSGDMGFTYTDGTSTSAFEGVTLTANTWQNVSVTSAPNKTLKYVNARYQSGGALIDLNTFMVEKGSTATEYEPYYAIPEMLTDEEALVAYLSSVTDTYPEEIKDPYDVRIVGYLKHLASVRFPEPDYPVNNEEFYLSTMEPTHTSNSEPSADIELDTADGKIISVEAYGDTKQQTYSGKNMLDVDFTTATKQGITFTNNGDSTITISGTPQAANDFPISPSAISLPITLTSGKNYTQRLEIISGSLGGMSLVPAFKNSQGTVLYNYFTNNSTRTSSDTLTCHSYNLFWGPATVGTAINATIRVWLEEGSDTSSPFEPYTGGVPSPNPDYPQDVNVVTGRQQINVSGKNLLDTEYSKVKSVPGNTSSGRTWNDTEKTMEYNGITYKFNEDGTITVSGSTGSAPSFLLLNDPIENLQEGSEYYMSGCPAGGNAASYSLRLYTTASTYTPEIGNGLAFTYGEQPFIRINISANIVADDLVFKPMIVNSSDAGDEFVPFQGYESYEINLGKNLFDGVLESGIINGKTGENAPNANYVRAKNYIPVKELTNYAVSSTNGDIASFNIYEYKADFTYNLTANRVVQKGRFWQTMAGTKYIRFRPAYQSADTTMKFQIELGSTATEYAPYFEPIELCKIGDYQDYIYKNGDDWYIHKEIEKIIVTGSSSEAWVHQTSNVGYMYRLTLPGVASIPHGEIANLVSDYFTPTTSGVIYNVTSGGYIAQLTTPGYIRFNIGDTTNKLSEFRTWLGTHNTTVYYALATPTDTKITDSTLIGQLDALADADTYDGKTYIKIVANDPNLPALLKVEAYKY